MCGNLHSLWMEKLTTTEWILSAWAFLRSLKTPDGINTFQRLAVVALLVLILPHSYAEEERVFSMVTNPNFDPASSSMERSQVF